ncbi:hypothetical protein APLC1_2134 [Limnospira platensis C1]|nr:hypothetical protein APLC1_2134 [Arthrospira platensis C1]
MPWVVNAREAKKRPQFFFEKKINWQNANFLGGGGVAFRGYLRYTFNIMGWL